MPDFHNLGQLGILLAGAGIAVKFLLPLIKPSDGNGVAEWRGRVETKIDENARTLSLLAENLVGLSKVVEEIERRGRDSEAAIRKVMAARE